MRYVTRHCSDLCYTRRRGEIRVARDCRRQGARYPSGRDGLGTVPPSTSCSWVRDSRKRMINRDVIQPPPPGCWHTPHAASRGPAPGAAHARTARHDEPGMRDAGQRPCGPWPGSCTRSFVIRAPLSGAPRGPRAVAMAVARRQPRARAHCLAQHYTPDPTAR